MQIVESNKPDFIIIGAMKAATSAIYEYIMQHPRVVYRLPKELHFFTLNYEKGLDWYLSQFEFAAIEDSQGKLLVGEASPSYLTSREAPDLIYRFFPEVKIIVSLRNPTDRAISQYYHQLNRVKDEHRPIEEAFSDREIANLTQEPHSKTHSYLQLGKYARQLKKWLEVFPAEQILILNYHDLETRPNYFVTQIFNFLDLEDYQIPAIKKIYSNQYPSVSAEIKARLDRYFEPEARELENSIGMQLLRNN